MPLLAALLLGLLAGLRTFTPPAVLWLLRHGSPLAWIFGAFALLEYVGDLNPRVPARTHPLGLVARAASGAFCGWAFAASAGASAVAGAAIGALAAIAGAYLGLAARTRAVRTIGRVPAALLEDCIALAGSVAVVVYL